MNSLKEIIDILELNFYDNLGEIKRILQLKMEIDVWNRKLASGVDPNSDDFIDEILLDDIKRIEEANHVNFGQNKSFRKYFITRDKFVTKSFISLKFLYMYIFRKQI